MLDNTSESVGKKIRSSEIAKVPYTVVIGEKEIENGKLKVRVREDLSINPQDQPTIAAENFVKTAANEIKTRVSKTSF